MEERELFERLMSACVRGCLPELPDGLGEKPLEELTDREREILYQLGKEKGLKLYRFKNTHNDLPRVRKVLGFLKGIPFYSLLDVGSGRGVFLFPLLEGLRGVCVTSADILEHRVDFLQKLSQGGIERLTAVNANICDQPFPDKSFDVVTLLEVLEHIPEVDKAVQAAVNMARKFVGVSVPNQPDDNPEHIHLLTKDRLTELFRAAGCERLRFDGVNGHLIMIATLDKP